jgi:hypothetical protein
MIARTECAGDGRSIRDKAKLDENCRNDDEDALYGEGANENKTLTGGRRVGVGPARKTVEGTKEEGANAECDDRGYRFEVGVGMDTEWLTGEAECCKYGVT